MKAVGRRCSEILGCGPRASECLSRKNFAPHLRRASGALSFSGPLDRGSIQTTRSTNSPVRVSIFTRFPDSMYEGTLISRPVSRIAGFAVF